ncbi:MAG: PHP domain-containing protein [Ruminococcaceae bacterium]|nr:PHP domain-containing protein [Oscillospiraceae bacterium]
MLPKAKGYAIYPAIVQSNKKTEMVIAPTERSFMLYEGEEYELKIIPVDGDFPSYKEPTSHVILGAVAKDGVLRFSYTFEGEMEFVVWLYHNEKKLQKMNVYALESDLLGLIPLKGDFHGHSYRSDGCDDPVALAGHYREQGYDFFSLTDHNRYYPGAEIDEAYGDLDLGITRVRGEEVHPIGSAVHIVHVGGHTSVCEQYTEDPEGFVELVKPYFDKIPANVPEKYHDRYAKCLWATDRIHAAGGLAIFAHPYWTPGSSQAHNVCQELARLLLTSGMFDAYELVGGMEQHGVNRSVALWNDLRAEQGLRIPVVGSSDVHAVSDDYAFPNYFTICFSKARDNDAIIDAVRKGLSVAVEASGDDHDRAFRCYGHLRLVNYAHFLLKHYFLPMQRICQGEGVAMRSYAMNDAPAALVTLQVEQTKRFCDRFFGRAEAPLPNADIAAFVARARARQLKGPITCGSQIISEKITRRV